MSANLLKNAGLACLVSLHMLTSLTAFAKVSEGGAIAGGGGDYHEERVSEIRSDILNWINLGGAKSLKLDSSLSYDDYKNKMKTILAPLAVVVNFVEKDHATDSELQVTVNGVPKTCRGFLSKKDNRPHILCNIERFNNTSESDQYRLVHHEYAGLVGLEKNHGAASDYNLSNQLTSYLQKQSVLKLAIKKQEQDEERVNPIVEVASVRYIKGQMLEVQLVAKNMEETHQITLQPFEKDSHKSIFCENKMSKLVFTKENKEQRVLLNAKKCGLSDLHPEFTDMLVEFNDGIIRANGFQRFYISKPYVGEDTPKVATHVEILKEKEGVLTRKDGKKLKTITKNFRFSFSADSSQLSGVNAFVFIDGDDFTSEHPEMLADYINQKTIEMAVTYVQDTYTDGVCLNVPYKCFFVKEKIGNGYTAKTLKINGKEKSLGSTLITFYSNGEKIKGNFILLENAYPELR